MHSGSYALRIGLSILSQESSCKSLNLFIRNAFQHKRYVSILFLLMVPYRLKNPKYLLTVIDSGVK